MNYSSEILELRDEFRKLGIWEPQIIHEVGERLLEQPLSEEQARAFHNWGHFLFFTTTSDPKFINLPGWICERMLIDKRDYDLGRVFRFCFGLAQLPFAIPYELWSDIAPHMLSEVKRFYESKDLTFEEFFPTLNWDVVEERKKMLEANPETKPMMDAWRASRG